MKNLFRFFAIVVVAGTVLMLPPQVFSAPSAAALTMAASAPYVEGEVLLKFRGSVSPGDRTLAIAARGHGMLADLDQGGWVRVKVGAGQSVAQALAAYQDDLNIEYVQPNYIYHISAVPSDTQYGQLWAFKNTGQTITNAFTQPPSSPLSYSVSNPGTVGDDMNIEKAWDHITDCSSAVVAVVDTGVNYNHADLAGNLWTSPTDTFSALHGYNVVDNNNDPMDRNGHGTHVAGIIGAVGNNAFGTTGVCWKASIMAVRVLDASGSGTTAGIIQGINFAVAHGAKVINMSLGGGGFDAAFSNAINTAQAADVVVVVAAGNDGANNDSGTTPTYPCNFTQPNLICVAALNQGYQLASFSNYGPTSVDVGAPGTNVLSTWAGTNAVITDPLTGGWTFTTTTSGGWAFGTNSGIAFLFDPAAYTIVPYNSNTDDRVYKPFNLGGANVAVVQFGAVVNVVNGDHFRVGCVSTGNDPFAGGGTVVLDGTNVATFPLIYPIELDISSCISANSSVGFQLQSGAVTPKDFGVGIMQFSIETLALNTTSYNTINGTSMATPEVAGLATMLRAYNPQYTAVDVVSSIKNGGRVLAALSGKTSSGRAVDVMSSLAYINPPTGLSYTVQ